MQRKRPKQAYTPMMDAMERREMLSNAPIAAIQARGLHRVATEFDRRERIPFADRDANGAPRFLQGEARLRPSRPGAKPAAPVGVEQQAAVAEMFLQLADPILASVAKSGPEAEAATNQVRQTLGRYRTLTRSQPDALVSAPNDGGLASILDTFGPGDPFASLDVVSVDSLKPGDIILRCTSGLGSQAIELAHWSRYSHVALYIGQGKIIDAMPSGVHTRDLSDLLADSTRASVLRVPDLTAAQAKTAIRAAQAQEGAAYNFMALVALEAQKVAGVIAHAGEGLGGVIGVLSRAERLPSSLVDNGTFACSQLVRYAFLKAGITLSQANGLAPGDYVRLGMVGVLDEVGRLEVPAQPAASANAWLP